MRSERPAPRTSRARKRRAGCCCQLSTRTRGFREEPWSAPGLQRLLDDIDAGLVDRIVVYKVDRLTRSLSDFAKLVDRLDAASTGFRLGDPVLCQHSRPAWDRLTLHMLLSSRNQAKFSTRIGHGRAAINA